MFELQATTQTPVEGYSVLVIYLVTNTLSVLGQLFIIITYFSIRKSSNKFYAYVACHSLIEFPWGITNYLVTAFAKSNSFGCSVVAFINIYSYVASMIWSTFIAWVIFSSLKKKEKIPSYKWYHLIITYFIAFLFLLFPLIERDFGVYAGSGISEIKYCWFVTDTSVYSYWASLILTTLSNIYFYARSIYIVRTNSSEETTKGFWNLLMFPIIQIVSNSGGFVKMLADAFDAGVTFYLYLQLLSVIFAKGQGLFESIAYTCNKAVRTEIAKVWCKRRQVLSQPQVEKPLFDSISMEKERSKRFTPSFIL